MRAKKGGRERERKKERERTKTWRWTSLQSNLYRPSLAGESEGGETGRWGDGGGGGRERERKKERG